MNLLQLIKFLTEKLWAYSIIYFCMELVSITASLHKRDTTIDILRGLAIFTMIGANMVPVLLKEDPSPLLRLYGSFAAPTFIFLSGMMVSFTVSKGNHTIAYFIKRSITLLLIGALIDIVVTGICPFMTFDVLYLIGPSILLTYLFKKLRPNFQYSVIIIIFSLTPLLQNVFGYHQVPLEMHLSQISTNIAIPVRIIFRQWLIDGWFPLFPWLGFAFLGSISADIRCKYKSFASLTALFMGLMVLILGEILWNVYPGQLFIRNGYSELFYPPTTGFVLTSIGVIIILFYIVDLKNNLSIYAPFSTLGRWSLQVYVIHLVLISLLGKILKPLNYNIFLFMYIGIFILILVLCSIMDKFKGVLKRLH